MKRLIEMALILSILAAILSGCQKAVPEPQGETVKKSKPRLKQVGPPPQLVMVDPTYNFGNMDQEQSDTHAFEIANEGRGELDLRIVNTTCGCTTVKLGDVLWEESKKGSPKGAPPVQIFKIKPGEKTTLEMEWKTEHKAGNFRTVATLDTNDPSQPTATYTVEGTIIPYVEISESQVKFTSPRNNQESTATMFVYSRQLEDLEITGVTSSNPLITAEFAPAPDAYLESQSAKSGLKGTVKIAPGLPIGPFTASMILHTNCKERPELTISASGTITGDVMLNPDHFDFKIVKAGEPSTLSMFVKVRNDSHVDVKVSRVVPDFLKVTLSPTESVNNRYKLTVEVPADAPGGDFKGGIELETTHPVSKMVKIPLRGQIAVTLPSTVPQ